MTTPAKAASRPRNKEAFFVQVKGADEKPVFFDATEQLGKPMPYSHPLATCAMRVSPEVVSFSLLKVTNKARQRMAEGYTLEIPRGPLAKLDRRAAAVPEDLAPNGLLVELGEDTHQLVIHRDENGTVTLDMADAADDVTFELAKSATQLSLYFRSPRGNRIVSVGFIGHLNKPGSNDTVTRAAALVLQHLVGLPAFRLVAGIETVNVPAPPARWAAGIRPARKPSEEAVVHVPVRLWTAATELVGSGNVAVKVDLDTANPVTGRLLYHFTPDADMAEAFDGYRGIFERGVGEVMTRHLGDADVEELVYSIALGELDDKGLERLRDAASQLTVGMDVAPGEWAPFPPA